MLTKHSSPSTLRRSPRRHKTLTPPSSKNSKLSPSSSDIIGRTSSSRSDATSEVDNSRKTTPPITVRDESKAPGAPKKKRRAPPKGGRGSAMVKKGVKLF
ncbi:hypothetical protein TrCOL_g2954 [Triparma columacea]|uniref:Uncharacterized protein n=1 Tax=Triparma columacea TaxID=722753 RepID=A0A9W7G4A9_9STRA|nr:hypothetical protein TrCOL_g2954 [Triparma columacea]